MYSFHVSYHRLCGYFPGDEGLMAGAVRTCGLNAPKSLPFNESIEVKVQYKSDLLSYLHT